MYFKLNLQHFYVKKKSKTNSCNSLCWHEGICAARQSWKSLSKGFYRAGTDFFHGTSELFWRIFCSCGVLEAGQNISQTFIRRQCSNPGRALSTAGLFSLMMGGSDWLFQPFWLKRERERGKRWNGAMVGSPRFIFFFRMRMHGTGELFYEMQEMTESRCDHGENPGALNDSNSEMFPSCNNVSDQEKGMSCVFEMSRIEDRRKSLGAFCSVRETDWAVASWEHLGISPAELQWGAGMFPINRLQIQSCMSSSL